MQSTSPSLATAITSGSREVYPITRIDWDRDGDYSDDIEDVSSTVSTFQISESIASGLPDQVRVVSGYITARAKVNITRGKPVNGIPTTDVEWWAASSPLSPIAGYEALNRPVQLGVGEYTTSQPGELTLLTGITRGLTVERGRTSIEVLDLMTRLQRKSPLPQVVADELDGLSMPGLRADWLVSYLFRQSGFHAIPSYRPSVVLYASMHGSVAPEVGKVGKARQLVAGTPLAPSFISGKFSSALAGVEDVDANNRYDICLTPSGPLSLNDNSNIMVQLFSKYGPTSSGDLVKLSSSQSSAYLLISVASGKLRVTMSRGLSTSGPASTATTGTNDWHYAAAHIGVVPGGANLNFMVDTAQSSGAILDGSKVGLPVLDQVEVIGELPIEGLQITAEPYTNTWDNYLAFVPNAFIEPSINKLIAVSPGDEDDGLELLKLIASAELAVVRTDPQGNAHYWTRNHWTTTEAQTSQATLTTLRDLGDLRTDQSLLYVINRCSVPVSPLILRPYDDIWTPTDPLGVRGGATTTLWATFPNAATNVLTSWATDEYEGYSWYTTNTMFNGEGVSHNEAISITVSDVSAQAAKLTITNSYPQTLWFVYPDGHPNEGQSAFHLRGQALIADTSSYAPEAIDQQSILEYGEQYQQLPRNPFRQTQSLGLGVASIVVSESSLSRPYVSDVEVQLNQAIEVGDRVRLQDPLGFHLDGEYWITEIERGNGPTMTISARPATTIALWDDPDSLFDRDTWS